MERPPFWVNAVDALNDSPPSGINPFLFSSLPCGGYRNTHELPPSSSQMECPAAKEMAGDVHDAPSHSFSTDAFTSSSVHPFFQAPTLHLRDLFRYGRAPRGSPSPPPSRTCCASQVCEESSFVSEEFTIPIEEEEEKGGKKTSQEAHIASEEEELVEEDEEAWEAILLSNYMIDFPWLLREVPELMTVKQKLVIVSGEKGTATHRRETAPSPVAFRSTSALLHEEEEEKRRPTAMLDGSGGASGAAASSSGTATTIRIPPATRAPHQKKETLQESSTRTGSAGCCCYVHVSFSTFQQNPFIVAIRERRAMFLQVAGASALHSPSSSEEEEPKAQFAHPHGKTGTPAVTSTTFDHTSPFCFSGASAFVLASLLSALMRKIVVVEPPLPLAYGSHHTKMVLLVHRRGLRVAILTGNFIRADWDAKTQGIYVQDFPRVSSFPVGCSSTPGPPFSSVPETNAPLPTTPTSSTSLGLVEPSAALDFKHQLQHYLRGCRVLPPDHHHSSSSFVFGVFGDKTFLDAFDFSGVRVRLIVSLPGHYRGRHEMSRFGMGRLAALQAYYSTAVSSSSFTTSSLAPSRCALLPRVSVLSWQFSSQGSLDEPFLSHLLGAMQGKAPFLLDDHPRGEKEIATKKNEQEDHVAEKKGEEAVEVQVIYPTEKEVRRSLEGWRGGLSLPVYAKCCHPFINARLHRWTGSRSTTNEEDVHERKDEHTNKEGEKKKDHQNRRQTHRSLHVVYGMEENRPCLGSNGPSSSVFSSACTTRHEEVIDVDDTESKKDAGEERKGAVTPVQERKGKEGPQWKKNREEKKTEEDGRLLHVTHALPDKRVHEGPADPLSVMVVEDEEEDHSQTHHHHHHPPHAIPSPKKPSTTMKKEGHLSTTTISSPSFFPSPYATALPHIKSYAGVVRSPLPLADRCIPTYLSWFLLTSANLSKAAWGKYTCTRSNRKRRRSVGGAQHGGASSRGITFRCTTDREEEEENSRAAWMTTIWSFELGVLFLPSMYFSSSSSLLHGEVESKKSTSSIPTANVPTATTTTTAFSSFSSSSSPHKSGFTCTPFAPLPSSVLSSSSTCGGGASWWSLLYPTPLGPSGKEVLYLPYDIQQPIPYASTAVLRKAEDEKKQHAKKEVHTLPPPQEKTVTRKDRLHSILSSASTTITTHKGIPMEDIPWVMDDPHIGVDSHGLQMHEAVERGMDLMGPSSWKLPLCPGGGVLQDW